MDTTNNKPSPTKKSGENKKIVAINARKNKRASTVAIITLSILLGLSLVLGLTAAFFSANQTATGNITLGNPVNINITQGGASVEALTFSGTAMPGTKYTQPIGVSVPQNTSDSVLRCKLTLGNAGGASAAVTATTSNDWTKGDDDYYYYNGVAKANDSLNFCTEIEVPKSLTNADATKVYAITFQVEAIQFANGAASEVWTTAPKAWVTSYGSGTTQTT